MRRLVPGFLLALAACPPDPSTGTNATTTQPSTSSTTDLGTTTTSGPTTPTTTLATTGSDGTSAPTSTNSSATTVEPGSTGDATTVEPGTGDATTTGEPGTTGDGALVISMKDVVVFADCPPNPEDDPIVATWVVVYDNSTNPAPASADLLEVDFGFNESDPPILLSWMAAPTASGPIGAGEVVEQLVMKVMGTSFPFCNVCGKDYHIGWTFDVMGEQVYIQFDDNLVCKM